MTYRDVINSIGQQKFNKIGKGWYNLDVIMTRGLDSMVDRYAILANVPFYIIHLIFNEDFEKRQDTSIYYWLSEIIDDTEVERILKKVKEIAEDK